MKAGTMVLLETTMARPSLVFVDSGWYSLRKWLINRSEG